MKTLSIAIIVCLLIFLSTPTLAQPGKPEGKGKTENATAIVTVVTQDIPGASAGIYSDLETHPSTPTIRYYDTQLNGEDDPDNPGTPLDDGDCIVASVAARDGVDNGGFAFFVPFLPSSCGESRLRTLEFRNPGFDFDDNGVPTLPGESSTENPYGRFGCNDVFPKDSPNPGVTLTSCNYEVRVYDPDDEFERTWIAEWEYVEVQHSTDPDLKRIEATTAKIFELRVPSNRRNGKKQKIEVSSPGGADLAFRIDVRRIIVP